MKILPVLVISIILAGCAWWPKQAAKDGDLLTKHVSANIAVPQAYANLQQGFRYCGEKYGFPQCKPAEKNGAALCDIYPDKAASEKPDRLLGRIQLSPEPSGTKAVLRIKKNAPNNEDTLIAWEIFMSGRVREACP